MHASVARALITTGGRVNAKDIMGNTPLGLAAGPFATAASLQVARTIAEHVHLCEPQTQRGGD
jgi:hypothetical protein